MSVQHKPACLQLPLTCTAKPRCARYMAAVTPAGPAPTTTAFLPRYTLLDAALILLDMLSRPNELEVIGELTAAAARV
jgi:hypothetical protein